MSDKGADLQTYNNELVRCIEELKERREEVNKVILREEEERSKIQHEIRRLTENLSRLNDSLNRKISARNEYDKTIKETEAAYAKIIESSQTLLSVLKRESNNIGKRRPSGGI
eukprot:TRINITY_DN8479_c0_g1_i1.p1 TRINITY_DN8479_c0_g1~~TRINITY_DN8479_c0_g1_i1.p1  ORF type:complete len:113 (+),score=15.72 TRINITY_DN8479_c0_g1_i1:76-414(+)